VLTVSVEESDKVYFMSGAYVSTDPRAVAPLFIDNFSVAIIRLTSIRQIAPVELLRCWLEITVWNMGEGRYESACEMQCF
jgi:hypothetical protein